MANRNTAGLLGNYDRNRIRFFSDSERSAMTQSKAAVQGFALTHGKNTGRRRDSTVTNDYSAVMQCRLRVKNAQDQFHRKIRIECHTGFFVNANRRVALDRKQRAELFVRQLRHRFGKVVHCLAFLAGQRKNRMPAELGEATTQFGLEDYDERNREEDR